MKIAGRCGEWMAQSAGDPGLPGARAAEETGIDLQIPDALSTLIFPLKHTTIPAMDAVAISTEQT